jgi:hypothetical protein
VKTRDNPAECFVLLREARELAAQSGDAITALGAIDEMGRIYAIDPLDLKIQTLTKILPLTTTVTAYRSLAEYILQVVEEAVLHDHYEAASSLLSQADMAARKASSAPLSTRIQTRAKEVGELQKEYEAMKAAVAVLKDKPEDPAANLTVGKYLCLRKGDWDRGVYYLANGEEAALAEQANKDLTNPKEAKAQVTVGDGWWKVGDENTGPAKVRFYARAATWYKRALPKLEGLEHTRIEKLITQAQEQTRSVLPDIVGELQRYTGHSGSVLSVALSPDGHYALSGGADGNVRLWDAQTGKSLGTLTGLAGEIRKVAFTGDGTKALAASSDELGSWDVATGRRLNTTRRGSPFETAVFSTKGRLAWTGGRGGSLNELRVEDSGLTWGMANQSSGTLRLLALSPNDRFVMYVTSIDEKVHLYDLESKKVTATLPTTLGTIRCAAFAPTGELMALAGDDKVIYVVNVGTLRTAPLKGHTGTITSLAFSSDGKRLLSGSKDNTVRVWNVGTRQVVQRFDWHAGPVNSVSISADGHRALSGSTDSTVRLWGLPK